MHFSILIKNSSLPLVFQDPLCLWILFLLGIELHSTSHQTNSTRIWNKIIYYIYWNWWVYKCILRNRNNWQLFANEIEDRIYWQLNSWADFTSWTKFLKVVLLFYSSRTVFFVCIQMEIVHNNVNKSPSMLMQTN